MYLYNVKILEIPLCHWGTDQSTMHRGDSVNHQHDISFRAHFVDKKVPNKQKIAHCENSYPIGILLQLTYQFHGSLPLLVSTQLIYMFCVRHTKQGRWRKPGDAISYSVTAQSSWIKVSDLNVCHSIRKLYFARKIRCCWVFRTQNRSFCGDLSRKWWKEPKANF